MSRSGQLVGDPGEPRLGATHDRGIRARPGRLLRDLRPRRCRSADRATGRDCTLRERPHAAAESAWSQRCPSRFRRRAGQRHAPAAPCCSPPVLRLSDRRRPTRDESSWPRPVHAGKGIRWVSRPRARAAVYETAVDPLRRAVAQSSGGCQSRAITQPPDARAGIRRRGAARGPLFLSTSHRNRAAPITLWTWSKVVRALALRANVPRFSTHTLRHLCLTDLARTGWELHAIATFAGHRSLATTLQYIHLSGRELAAKLARGMAEVHAWRVAQIAELLVQGSH